MINQLVQVVGSLLLLVAFGLNTSGRLKASALPYLLVNLIAAALLAVTAVVAHQWGFVLLETVWGAVAAVGLWREARKRFVPPHAAEGSEVDRATTEPERADVSPPIPASRGFR